MMGGGYGEIAVGGVAGAVIIALVNWFINRKTTDAQAEAVVADATGKTELIEALAARIKAQEERQNEQETQLRELRRQIDEEITLRRQSQEESFKLRLRVTELEAVIRQMGGVVPEHMTR